MPIQVKESPEKVALISDMSVLNDLAEQASFKLEGWKEMFEFGIKFDFKKSFTIKLILRKITRHFLDSCTKWPITKTIHI